MKKDKEKLLLATGKLIMNGNQWLYEQFEKRELKTPAVPSFVAFRDWKG